MNPEFMNLLLEKNDENDEIPYSLTVTVTGDNYDDFIEWAESEFNRVEKAGLDNFDYSTVSISGVTYGHLQELHQREEVDGYSLNTEPFIGGPEEDAISKLGIEKEDFEELMSEENS